MYSRHVFRVTKYFGLLRTKAVYVMRWRYQSLLQSRPFEVVDVSSASRNHIVARRPPTLSTL